MKEIKVEFTYEQLASMVPERPAAEPEPMTYTGPPARNGCPMPNTPEEHAHARAVYGWSYWQSMDRWAKAMADERERLIVEQVIKNYE